MDDSRKIIAAQQLLAGLRLTPQQVSARLDDALQPEFWKHLNPELSIEKTSDLPAESRIIGSEPLESAYRSLTQDGYFQFGPVLPAGLIGRMRACVENLHRHGWPLTFSYVYDEFWEICRERSLVEFIGRFLGPGFLQNAAVWTYWVGTGRGGAGWPPHVDGRDDSRRLTVWIPLSDAQLDNGCMYVVPRSDVAGALPPEFYNLENMTRQQLGAVLHATRALPAQAGSILGWDHQLMHWGSRPKDPDSPRISIGVEFLPADLAPFAFDLPLAAMDRLPPFAQRLEVIGKSMLAYSRFEPALVLFQDLAKRLVSLST